jgi:spermidine synthase
VEWDSGSCLCPVFVATQRDVVVMHARPATSPPESAGVAHATSDRKFYLLFFLSGVPALLYQIVWQRALFTIYGVNIESVTIIVTVFMLGLGLGSLAGGWLSKRLSVPLLRLFAAIEAGIAVFGCVSMQLFRSVASLTVGAGAFQTGIVTCAHP